MKTFSLSLIFIFYFFTSYSQAPVWIENFQETNYLETFNSGDSLYASTGEDTSNSQNYKSFSRWKRFWDSRLSIDGSPNLAYQALAKLSENPSVCNGSTQYPNSWSNITSETGKNFRGRIERVAIAPHNNAIAFAGSYHAGLWRTENFQSTDPTWVNVTDNLRLPGMGVSGIAFDQNFSSNGTMYISTGRGEVGDNEYGMGLLKSTDYGITWQFTNELSYSLTNPIDVIMLQGVICHPTQSNVLFALRDKRLYRSTDGGVSFPDFDPTNTTTPSPIFESPDGGFIRDVVFSQSDSKIVFITTDRTNSSSAKVYMSLNEGETFAEITGQIGFTLNSRSRIDIATVPGKPSWLYLVAAGTDASTGDATGISQFAFSENNGINWEARDHYTADNINGYHYNDLAVSNYNSNIIYVGGAVPSVSYDKGLTFIRMITYSVNSAILHPDTRQIKVYSDVNNNDLILLANDGGLNIEVRPPTKTTREVIVKNGTVTNNVNDFNKC